MLIKDVLWIVSWWIFREKIPCYVPTPSLVHSSAYLRVASVHCENEIERCVLCVLVRWCCGIEIRDCAAREKILYWTKYIMGYQESADLLVAARLSESSFLMTSSKQNLITTQLFWICSIELCVCVCVLFPHFACFVCVCFLFLVWLFLADICAFSPGLCLDVAERVEI